MLLIRTTHKPATDLGFLLHKNPDRIHEAKMSFGKAVAVFPQASDDLCTVAVLLDVDSVGTVRGKGFNRWDQYVNDRPYVASSYLCQAITEFFRTAMSGRSKERQDLADQPIPLEFEFPVIKCRGGEAILRKLFEPLGYVVTCKALALDDQFPEWGESQYFHVHLSGNFRVKDALSHIYVLVPVLDDDKHYWIGKDEIEKLLRRGADWLPNHPMKQEIAFRYLDKQRQLTRLALSQLVAADGDPDPDATEEKEDEKLEGVERKLSLHEQRLAAAEQVILKAKAKSVLDLGCGEGRLIQMLMRHAQIKTILGVDISLRTLTKAEQRLNWGNLSEAVKKKVTLKHSGLTYRDRTLEGFDAAALVEVIEHLDEPRLESLERVVFEFARPETVVVTTPNREYNALFETLDPTKLRHGDHRFEWTRAEFVAWCTGVAERRSYEFEITPIGPIDETHGAPSQMAVFTR